MTRYCALPGLDASAYTPHALHAEDRVWVEKNCYVDLFIELIHGLGQEPLAMLPFTATLNFEGDQWTFYKPSHADLRDLYGIEVNELTVWRPLIEHAKEHLAAGRLIATESDAYWLPDTAGTDYRRQHTKTSIVLVDLDTDAQSLGYFHNAGYHRLQGEDFRQVFRLDAAPDPCFMPLFAELVRVDRMTRRSAAELAELSLGLLRKHMAWRPAANPIRAFAERFAHELPAIQALGLEHYHVWAFATIRQLGSGFELLAANLNWIGTQLPQHDFSAAAQEFLQIASINKAFILKVARAVNAKRALDAGATFDEMAQAWDRGMDTLAVQLQQSARS